MPKTRLISPGIANHSLKKNLSLNDHYISNDGGDEGIRIDDAGEIGLGIDNPTSVIHTAKAGSGDHWKLTKTSVGEVGYIGADSTGLLLAGDSSVTDATIRVNNNQLDLDFVISGDDSEIMRTDGANHRVGIGVTDPDTKLEVLHNGTQQKWSYDADSFATMTVGDSSLTTLATGESGNFLLDVAGVITLDAAGATWNLDVGGSTYHQLTYNSYQLMNTVSDSGDYFKFAIATNGATNFTTVDDNGTNLAQMTFSPQGNIELNPGANSEFRVHAVTKTASGTTDATAFFLETLAYGSGVATVDDTTPTPSAAWEESQTHTDVTQTSTDGSGSGLKCDITTDGSGNPTFAIVTKAPSGGYAYAIDEEITFTDPGDTSNTAVIIVASITDGSGGSDVHYGLRYEQTQTDLTGWDSVYFMHLTGGDAARTFVVQGDGKVGMGVADPDTLLEIFGTSSQLKLSYDADSFLSITVADASHTTIATGESGNLILDSAGDITLEVGGHVKFDGCAAGFVQVEPSWGDANTIGGGGTSTDIDFRTSNKQHLTLAGNHVDGQELQMIFPTVSGNFLLFLLQDGTGDRTVHEDAWRAYSNDESTNSAVIWAGGTAPTLTTTAGKADIVSIYWDADNDKAYGVISQDF